MAKNEKNQNNQAAPEQINVTEKSAAPKKKSIFSSRKFKYGSVATALTAVVVVVVVVVNLLFSMLADAYSWRMDLTSTDIYEIAQETKNMVDTYVEKNDAVEKIEIEILCAEADMMPQFTENIKRFCNLSDKIDYTYINTVVNPQILSEYVENYAEYDIQEGYIVVKNGDRMRVIKSEDMVASTYDQISQSYVVTDITIQSALASAVLYVTKDEIPMVYFITGHNESGYEAIMRMIANNGADVQIKLLDQIDTFDDNARAMFICGPTADFTSKEIAKLDAFIRNNNKFERDIFYFHNALQAPKNMPNLKGFLEDWGIQINYDMVMDSEEYTTVDSPRYIYPTMTGTTINDVEEITITSSQYLMIPESCSITPLIKEGESNADGINVTTLAKTSEDSWSQPCDSMSANYEKRDEDQKGPFTLAAMSTFYTSDNSNVLVASHVFAAGSLQMLDETYLKGTGNGEFVFSAYQKAVGENDEVIKSASKDWVYTTMSLSADTIRWTAIFFVGVIPGICLVAGLIVYIRRRYL